MSVCGKNKFIPQQLKSEKISVGIGMSFPNRRENLSCAICYCIFKKIYIYSLL